MRPDENDQSSTDMEDLGDIRILRNLLELQSRLRSKTDSMENQSDQERPSRPILYEGLRDLFFRVGERPGSRMSGVTTTAVWVFWTPFTF